MTDGLETVGEKLTQQISEQNNTLTKCIVDQQKDLINYLINKENEDQENHNNMITDRMNLAEEVNQKLKDIMNIHGAQRAFILEFHNTSYNLSGLPFAKYSCNYEWFDRGMIPLGDKCIGLPFSSISTVVKDVLKSDTQQKIYKDLNEIELSNPMLHSLLKDIDAKGMIYNGLFDKNNQLVGLLVLEYVDEFNPEEINMHQLDIQAAEITSLLNIRYKYS